MTTFIKYFPGGLLLQEAVEPVESSSRVALFEEFSLDASYPSTKKILRI